ncbi:hypothetical protein AB7V82_13085 [Providencia stuartii]|uniref:cell envelope integrity protein TolA n=1 Tax=Providencia stuartii TaxID=588 RepID=UPI0034E38BCB
MYNVGTVTTTANSTKLIGVGTKWKENINLVLPMQMIQIQIGNTVHNNSIHSIQSNTELTLNFPIPTAQTGAKYVIFTTTMDSISAAANAIVAMNSSNVQFSDIQNRIMTESGVIDVKLPDGTVRKTRTEAERDKLLDGKFDKTGGTITGAAEILRLKKSSNSNIGLYVRFVDAADVNMAYMGFGGNSNTLSIANQVTNKELSLHADGQLKYDNKNVMMQGDFGLGAASGFPADKITAESHSTNVGFYYVHRDENIPLPGVSGGYGLMQCPTVNPAYRCQLAFSDAGSSSGTLFMRRFGDTIKSEWAKFYHERNTTKDSNGNLKAASPIVKVFADHIETNDESEGVEMERLGVGHYLIKGVVGFNSDGAWGINNGFVIPQDHNGKNMVLIDYKVRPDGDIEVFVFHQQNADLPERFQNKRIKYIDKDGNPVYYENYEQCDVPESRWIDMRVEMPVNSIYNLKQAEVERLAKEEADRQAEEEAKNAEIEAEEDI